MALVFNDSSNQFKLIENNSASFQHSNVLNIADKLIQQTRLKDLKWQQPLISILPFFKNNSVITKCAYHPYFGKIKVSLEVKKEGSFTHLNAFLTMKDRNRQMEYNESSSDPVNPVYQLAMIVIGKEYLRKYLKELKPHFSKNSYVMIKNTSTNF